MTTTPQQPEPIEDVIKTVKNGTLTQSGADRLIKEIERLKGGWIESNRLHDLLIDKDAEIERLDKESKLQQYEHGKTLHELADKCRELERLRGLEGYVRHKHDCNAVTVRGLMENKGNCTCGLAEKLKGGNDGTD